MLSDFGNHARHGASGCQKNRISVETPTAGCFYSSCTTVLDRDQGAAGIGDNRSSTFGELRTQNLDQRREIDPSFAGIEDRPLRRDRARIDTRRD